KKEWGCELDNQNCHEKDQKEQPEADRIIDLAQRNQARRNSPIRKVLVVHACSLISCITVVATSCQYLLVARWVVLRKRPVGSGDCHRCRRYPPVGFCTIVPQQNQRSPGPAP